MKSGRHNRRLFHWRKCSCVSTKTKVLAESFVWAAMLDVDVIQHGRPIQNSVIILEILNFLNYSYFAKIMTRKPKIGSLTNMTELLVYLVSWWRDATWKPIIISLQLLLSCCVYRNCSRDPVKKKRRKKKKKRHGRGSNPRSLVSTEATRPTPYHLATAPPRKYGREFNIYSTLESQRDIDQRRERSSSNKQRYGTSFFQGFKRIMCVLQRNAAKQRPPGG